MTAHHTQENSMLARTVLVLATALLAATSKTCSAEAPGPAPDNFQVQGLDGAALFGQHCMSCHGIVSSCMPRLSVATRTDRSRSGVSS
jgi:mono/diheme cytochrome c family protein